MNTKSILILKGSPREKGNSSILADQAEAGASELGGSVEKYYLSSMDIRPCDACDSCLETNEGCIIEDDMQILYPKLLAADCILIASPVYWFSMSAQTKTCIDRWYALSYPKTDLANSNRKNKLAGKKFGIILTSEDSALESGAANAVKMLQDICLYIHADLVGVVHGQALKAGDILKQPTVLKQAYELGQKLALI